MPLRGDVYVADLIAKFEKERTSIADVLGNHFQFRKLINTSTKQVPTDLVELELNYAEVGRVFMQLLTLF